MLKSIINYFWLILKNQSFPVDSYDNSCTFVGDYIMNMAIFAAFENDEIIAFTLNGIGTFNGIPTAYDTGTGTIKQYREQNIAGKNHHSNYKIST